MSNRLKEHRKLRNITMSELASNIQVGQSTLSEIENSKHAPSIQVAFKLANFFGISIEDLFPQFKDNTGSKKTVGV